GLVWPVPFGGEIFGQLTEAAVGLQNGIMEWCASLAGGAVEVNLPLWAAVGIYCGIIYLSVPLGKYSDSRRRRILDNAG
ncbi:MAG: hypothetical protein LUE10_02865, partial [Alistipes sp.]|nr:hypothetical protein [Alistipes sp.]